MTAKELYTVLKESGVPTTYLVADDTSQGAYLVYYESAKDTAKADDKVYYHESRFNIELYSKKKDLALEEKVISLLDDNEIPWDGGDTDYLDTEDVYMTTFYV